MIEYRISFLRFRNELKSRVHGNYVYVRIPKLNKKIKKQDKEKKKKN